jgi:Protein of unknown function (DUF642)/PEP-CTERM motif
MRFNHQLLFAASLLAAGAAQATVVFADNFDANSPGLNANPKGWTLNAGTVDIIGTNFIDLLPSNGFYIDLDGSTGQAGTISQSLLLTGGVLHTLSFELAGNQRDTNRDLVTVHFGDIRGMYSLSQSAGFTSYSLSFTPAITGNYSVSFTGAGNDNIGMLLDNVSVTAVPEPQTYALMALGLLAIGATARRRNR